MKYVPRNEYFELIGKLGVKKVESEYEIADLDLSSYSLNEDTKTNCKCKLHGRDRR